MILFQKNSNFFSLGRQTLSVFSGTEGKRRVLSIPPSPHPFFITLSLREREREHCSRRGEFSVKLPHWCARLYMFYRSVFVRVYAYKHQCVCERVSACISMWFSVSGLNCLIWLVFCNCCSPFSPLSLCLSYSSSLLDSLLRPHCLEDMMGCLNWYSSYGTACVETIHR